MIAEPCAVHAGRRPIRACRAILVRVPAPVEACDRAGQFESLRARVDAGKLSAQTLPAGTGQVVARLKLGRENDAENIPRGKYGVRRLGACRAWDVESENWPQRGQFLPDLQAHSPAMGQKDGENWTAAADLQPTFPKTDRLLGKRIKCPLKIGETLWTSHRQVIKLD